MYSKASLVGIAWRRVGRLRQLMQSPVPRSIESPDQGKLVAIPHVGGLHHEYRRAA
jgi:hypothetical protein